jgi:DNA-binding IclR family transcriptional regulator
MPIDYKQEIHMLHNRGLSPYRIARAVGVPKKEVVAVLGTPVPQVATPIQMSLLQDFLCIHSIGALSEKYGLTKARVLQIKNNLIEKGLLSIDTNTQFD